MKTYYLIRHGETFATKKNGGYGLKRLSASILEEGKPKIKKMAEYLKSVPTDYNVSSPLRRCKQTAEIITLATGKQFVTDSRVNEYLLEPFGWFQKRIKNFIKSMEDSKYENILICTHGAVLAGLIAFLTEKEFKITDMTSYPPPGVLTQIKNGKVESFDFNI